MNGSVPRHRIFVFLAALLLSPTAPAAGGLAVQDPWVRAAPPVSGMTAAYLIIENAGATPRTLQGVQSDAFERIELHRTVEEAGVARMLEQTSIGVPAGGRVVLRPGDYHLMLMGFRQPLQAGDSVELRLLFDGEEMLSVTAPVRKGAPGAEAHEHAHHEHRHH